MAASIPRRAVRRIARRSGRVHQHDMLEHPAERYYFDQYMATLDGLFTVRRRVLDLGCQHGRFVVPLVAQGHDVVGTDIDPASIDALRQRCPGAELHLESVSQTCDRVEPGSFDVVMCLEVLYVLPDWESLLPRLAAMAGPGGRLVTSHRSIGYYVYRLTHEGRYDELDQVLAGTHPQLNAQTGEQLRTAYQRAGLQVDSVSPIGAFSGFEVDPFSRLNDPGELGTTAQGRLMELERRPGLADRFADSARYLLVVATNP